MEVEEPISMSESKPRDESAGDTSFIIPPRNAIHSLSKKKHRKNLLGLSVAFMLNFTAFNSLQSLQSSLNYKQGLGLASLSVIYGCLTISCLVSPVIIRAVGSKWTVVASMICYSLYTVANFYPEFYTLIPAAAILGFAGGPLWTAQGTYLTTLAISFADIVNVVPEIAINQYNGVFYLFYQTNNIWGNLLSAAIFTLNTTREITLNETELWKCGRNGTGKEGMNYDDPGKQKTNLLLSIYLICGVLAVLVAILFMDSIRSNSPRQHDQESKTIYLAKHLLEVIRLMKTPYIALLIPMMIYSGFGQAFISGAFTKSFVSCTVGVRGVGYVMIVYGLSGSVSSYAIGRMKAFVSRQLIFTVGGVVNLITILWMLLWRARADVEYQFYLMATGWGFANAVWQTQLSSILGVLMPSAQEAAFACFRFWQAVGSLVSFGASISNNVLVLHKLLANLGLLVISLLLYYIVECAIIRERDRETRERAAIN